MCRTAGDSESINVLGIGELSFEVFGRLILRRCNFGHGAYGARSRDADPNEELTSPVRVHAEHESITSICNVLLQHRGRRVKVLDVGTRNRPAEGGRHVGKPQSSHPAQRLGFQPPDSARLGLWFDSQGSVSKGYGREGFGICICWCLTPPGFPGLGRNSNNVAAEMGIGSCAVEGGVGRANTENRDHRNNTLKRIRARCRSQILDHENTKPKP